MTSRTGETWILLVACDMNPPQPCQEPEKKLPGRCQRCWGKSDVETVANLVGCSTQKVLPTKFVMNTVEII